MINDKQMLFNEVGKEISKVMGITCPNIYLLIKEEDVLKIMQIETRGVYDYTNYYIYINNFKYKNPYLLLETLLHEMAHVFLHFIIDKQIYEENIETLSFKKYQKFTNLDKEQYNSFKNFFSQFKITKKYGNLVLLDKIYNRNNFTQPYFYNTDSTEIFAEYTATKFMNEIFKTINFDNIALSEMVKQLNYCENEVENLKDIYVEENATDRTPLKVIAKIVTSIKTGDNLFDIKSFDIEQYNDFWKYYKDEFKKLKFNTL
jgi:hypothetical protein